MGDALVDHVRPRVTLREAVAHVRAYPISVDPDEFGRSPADDAVLAEAEAPAGGDRPERLVLRVDRTDPSKNVVRGFHAFARFLARHPEWHGRVQMLALLDPSRQEIPDYAEYVGAIHRAAREVNDQFSDPGWTPIDLRVSDNFAQAIAAYKQYDVLLVNAIVDGMNLIAKEAPLVNERAGVLVLSENAGAHEELGAFALSVNPFDVEGTADAIEEALDDAGCERSAARAEGIRDARPRARRARLDHRPAGRSRLDRGGERAVSDSMLIVAALNGTRSRARVPEGAAHGRGAGGRGEAGGRRRRRARARARPQEGRPAGLRPVHRGRRARDPRARSTCPISISTQRTRAIVARHRHRAVRRAPRAARPGDRRRAAAPSPTSRRTARRRGRSSRPASGRACGPSRSRSGVDSLGDFETLYNDSLLSKAPYIVAELGPSDGRGSDRMAGTPHNVLRLADACRATFSRFDVVMSGQDEASPIAQAVAAAAGHHVRVRLPGRGHAAGRQRGRLERRAGRDGGAARGGRRPASDGAGRRARAAALSVRDLPSVAPAGTGIDWIHAPGSRRRRAGSRRRRCRRAARRRPHAPGRPSPRRRPPVAAGAGEARRRQARAAIEGERAGRLRRARPGDATAAGRWW